MKRTYYTERLITRLRTGSNPYPGEITDEIVVPANWRQQRAFQLQLQQIDLNHDLKNRLLIEEQTEQLTDNYAKEIEND